MPFVGSVSGGGGASSLGDLSDIGAMGEPIAQADNLAEVMTAMGGASAVRSAVNLAAYTYTFAGGALDYTAESAYNPSGSTSTGRPSSGLLGDGTSVPRFFVYGRDFVSALARTTTPSLRVSLTTANGESLLAANGASNSGANLIFPLPPSLGTRFQITATIATNIPTSLSGAGTDFASTRFGLLRRDAGANIPPTTAMVDLFTFALESSGAITESCATDTAYGSPVTLTGEVSGSVIARDVRITMTGAETITETKPAGSGSYTERRNYIDVLRRVTNADGFALCLALGQIQSVPIAGYWAEIRALTITPL